MAGRTFRAESAPWSWHVAIPDERSVAGEHRLPDCLFVAMNKLTSSTRSLAGLKQGFIARFKAFLGSAAFPCVGAKSAMNRGRMEFGLYDSLADEDDAAALCGQLAEFS